MAALAGFIDFSSLGYRPDPAARRRDADDDRDAFDSSEDDSDISRDMTREAVERAFGPPVSGKQHREGALTVTTLTFAQPNRRIVADFVEDVLFRFSVSSR